VQLAIVAFFSVMYFVVPATSRPARRSGDAAGIVPVRDPGGAAAVVRGDRPVEPRLACVFRITEMAVLMFTIWAYHLQFEAQPSLYLKSTGLFYAFIMIALRSLRFEPLWVILSGLSPWWGGSC
jgi:adenylate cyclase